jgi:hypothetical protein
VESRESGETKAEEATDSIDKGHVCHVCQTCGRVSEEDGARKKVPRTEGLLRYDEISKADCFLGEKTRGIWKRVRITPKAGALIHTSGISKVDLE